MMMGAEAYFENHGVGTAMLSRTGAKALLDDLQQKAISRAGGIQTRDEVLPRRSNVEGPALNHEMLAQPNSNAPKTQLTRVEYDDDVIYAQFNLEKGGEASLMGNIVQHTDEFAYVNKVHVDGPGAGSSNRAELRRMAILLGRELNVNELTIQGATRTTGANPGGIPKPQTFKIPK